LLLAAAVVVDLIPHPIQPMVVVEALAAYYQGRLQSALRFHTESQLALAVLALHGLTAATARLFLKPLLVAVLAAMENLLLVKMVRLAALAVVVVTLISLEEAELLAKVITAAIVRSPLAVVAVQVLLVVRQMAVLE
jgi:hypothetical protein